MQIVNGYVCQTSCDVAAAKHGHDPKNPHDDPVKAEILARSKGIEPKASDTVARELNRPSTGFASEAMSFGGILAALTQPTGDPAPRQLLDIRA